ncbi:UNVERIFIED_CONTAM: hypothetical protein FKN15_055736, partial [Acipenser sinensis]
TKKKKPQLISTEDRVQTYEKGTLHADGRILFCSICNVSLDHLRKGTIDKHLDSAMHKNKKMKLEVQARQLRNKQVTITGLFKKSTERGETRYVNTFELVEDFSATNIPIQGLVNEILQRFLMKTIPNCGAVPNSDTLRREHLPEAYAAHEEYLKWQNERFRVCLRCMRRGH